MPKKFEISIAIPFIYVIIAERDCTQICVEAEGCGFRPVFPWSMSDLEPGEQCVRGDFPHQGCCGVSLRNLRLF